MTMWRKLPQEGVELREVRIQGAGKDHDVIIVPRSGERVRFAAAGGVELETKGGVIVRSETLEKSFLRVTISAPNALLERGEVQFEGSDREWDELWRRARTRSRPWWQKAEGDGEEIDLDWAMQARLTIGTR